MLGGISKMPKKKRKANNERNMGVKTVKILIYGVPELVHNDLKHEAWVCRMSLNMYLLELLARRHENYQRIRYLSERRAKEGKKKPP